MDILIVAAIIGYLCYRFFKKSNTVNDDDVLQLGGVMSNMQITIKSGMVSFRGAYGDKAMVPSKHIQSISLSPNGFGKSDIIITGNGSELARIKKIPSSWAENAMGWMMAKLELF